MVYSMIYNCIHTCINTTVYTVLGWGKVLKSANAFKGKTDQRPIFDADLSIAKKEIIFDLV
jgi:hypothetical protein